MREEWQTRPLGEICDVIGGGTPAKGNSAFYEGDIPWATIRDMKSESLSKTEFRISKEAVKKSSTNIIPGHNVVIATRVGLGKVCLLEQDTAINQDLRGIIPKTSGLDVRYLFRWLQSVSHVIEAEGTGATVKGVKLPFIKSLQIPLPPLPEQKRIVTILDEAFAGIAAAVANTEKNLANARELFESHLNAVFTRKGDGWVEKKLGEIGSVQTGTTPKTSQKDNFGTFIPFIKPADFAKDGSLDYENEGLSKSGLKNSRLMPSGSVLMVCIGATIGKTAYTERGVATNQQINALTPEDGTSFKLLYYQMLTLAFQNEVIRNASQATLPIINKTKWSNLSVTVPPTTKEQEGIVSMLDSLLIETQRLESIYQQKLNSLAELKQSILQKAFSGELNANPDRILKEVCL